VRRSFGGSARVDAGSDALCGFCIRWTGETEAGTASG
jgi:hypothetical protein